MFKRIETGVMVMKDGKAWGVKHKDGYSTSYGWIDPTIAPIHDPEFCTKTTSVTHRGSPYTKELETAQLVFVRRRVEVEIIS
jgi:hypothetical protein